jgi:hypothetical protein
MNTLGQLDHSEAELIANLTPPPMARDEERQART